MTNDFILAHKDIYLAYIEDDNLEEHSDDIIAEMQAKWADVDDALFEVSRILYDLIVGRYLNTQRVDGWDLARPIAELVAAWGRREDEVMKR